MSRHSALFHFDAERHEYTDAVTGEVLPHITGMLNVTDWTDDRWYTVASQKRGQEVHRLTAKYDLGELEDVATATTDYKGWLLAHIKAMDLMKPEILEVEQASVHPVYRYGGRPDRLLRLFGLGSVLEVKSGPFEKGHPIQLALQAILVASKLNLPPEAVSRFGLYLQRNGKYSLEQFKKRTDFDEAYRVIRATCRTQAA